MSHMSQKTLAIVAAAAFATATPLALAPATAQVAATAAAGVDIAAPASLTIDKRIGEVGPAAPTATETFDFTVERINLTNNLDTAAGWDEVQAIIAGTQTPTVASTTTITTDAVSGQGTANLPVGLYRVTEVQNGNYTVAAPFYVTLPLTESGGTINYNPTISPKNQELNPTKAADDTNVGVGDAITYTIKAPVPVGDAFRDGTRSISQFRIEDPLMAELAYVADSAEVTLLNAGGATLAPADYTVTPGANNTLIVDFTEAGRAKLAELRATNPGLTAQVVFDATVLQIPANGELRNEANVYIPNAEDPIKTTPEDPTQQNGDNGATSTQYVNVAITKTLDGADSADAAGAEFNVVACTADGNGRYTIDADSTPLVSTNPEGTQKVTGPIATVATGQAAIATGYGMQFTREQDYCAVETKAPAGYLINPDPTPLNLSTPNADGRPVYTATVNNVKDNLFGRLPATGETTMLALLALGLVLFAGGAAYQLRRKNA
ncbi:LPXTG-motif cell wall anchor domain-containing protein/fimbrial isopeptide formation D2 domain-containing protein [Corynebacterium mycetoides]|uniref:LPXTG-motif cell wall anchor domain-containing protein/fimbrial isopeptide formation D2 domain-containing protein n=1 Tax=Corynebacterium mycetoides TaxID=38302 RepID=A0A1G9P4L5_9CORY|nr:SpaH/EbpB family LPXTG-anchored major pilin [Corynebacterium mycetoides]SDL93822.1 LPXTG-motif cell wall anchor domain-containing protein/fimbrial isopeptide formation D2 domain-containing protein [Corynebacterium mycetoides]